MSEEDMIDPDLLLSAFRATTSRAGMGSMYLRWNPYTCKWGCVIDYADCSKFSGWSANINDAIRMAVARLEG